ncbi:hypothetical protein BDZ97DRAFT_1760876 [Flammula alnicola]|nr:hypothetical protein BDZ97DRAFT_1760876 [Flammula alnicola]
MAEWSKAPESGSSKSYLVRKGEGSNPSVVTSRYIVSKRKYFYFGADDDRKPRLYFCAIDFPVQITDSWSPGSGFFNEDDNQFIVQVLTGGDNEPHRMRSKKLTLETSAGVVLKHAPPYIATDPSQPMSVDRQVVEKRALQILAGEDPEFPQIEIVGDRRNTKEKNVLWMADLGRIEKIEQVASELGAFSAELYRATSDPPPRVLEFISDPSEIYD